MFVRQRVQRSMCVAYYHSRAINRPTDEFRHKCTATKRVEMSLDKYTIWHGEPTTIRIMTGSAQSIGLDTIPIVILFHSKIHFTRSRGIWHGSAGCPSNIINQCAF